MNKYIVFKPDTATIPDGYEINTKYKITKEDSNDYYLGKNAVSKIQECIDYHVGEIVKQKYKD